MTCKLLLGTWDWVFVVWSLLVTLGIGLWYGKRAGKDLSEYFLSGRKLPGWALGTSMVATTFAADTPLVVAGLVVAGGIAKNWLWWSFLFGGTLTVFVFARWWRRAEVVTEIELLHKRYDGEAARALRGFKAVFLGLVVNSIIFGFVTKAMLTICSVVFDVPPWQSLAILLALSFVYTILSGLWGVVATDVLQFAMAMVGALVLAGIAVSEVGGLPQLVDRIRELDVKTDLLAMVPTGWNALSAAVLILVLVNWWAVYYPGAEPGGGGYVAQRMAAAIDENHARFGTLWFIFAHYVVRPWPWILVALAALVLEPRFLQYAGVTDPDAMAPEVRQFFHDGAYPWMFRYLPVGVLGLVIASFFAAFMSTITTTLNLSASYLVNDLYLPFMGRSGDEPAAGETAPPPEAAKHQVAVARATVAFVAATGSACAWILDSVGSGWVVIMDMTAGTGLVLILRWLWWRVNAWSEIAAMLASAFAFAVFKFSDLGKDVVTRIAGEHGPAGEVRLVLIVLCSTAVWVPVTLLTKPVGEAKLRAFYAKVRPGGFWGRIPAACGLPRTTLGHELRMWLAATAMIFGALLGIGAALLQRGGEAGAWLCVSVASGLWLSKLFDDEKKASAP